MHRADSLTPLAELPHAPYSDPSDGKGVVERTIDKRVVFVPEANVIILLPLKRDHLLLKRFDLDQSIAEAGIEHLVVTSQAPTAARLSEAFGYQISVESSGGDVKFKLAEGPEEMSVDAGGKLSWTVPEDFEHEKTHVSVLLSDSSGQQALHRFTLGINGVAEKLKEEKDRKEKEYLQRIADRNKDKGTAEK